MGHVYIQKAFVVYLKFELNWVSCMFVYATLQPYPQASPSTLPMLSQLLPFASSLVSSLEWAAPACLLQTDASYCVFSILQAQCTLK